MATLAELGNIVQDNPAEYGALEDKVMAATLIEAEGIISGATPSNDELTWSRTVLENPGAAAKIVTRYVVAANDGASIAQIFAASDAAIQSNVATAVSKLSIIIVPVA